MGSSNWCSACAKATTGKGLAALWTLAGRRLPFSCLMSTTLQHGACTDTILHTSAGDVLSPVVVSAVSEVAPDAGYAEGACCANIGWPLGVSMPTCVVLTCTAVVVPPVHRSCSSMRPPRRKARLALPMSPCRSPIATRRGTAGQNVVIGCACDILMPEARHELLTAGLCSGVPLFTAYLYRGRGCSGASCFQGVCE